MKVFITYATRYGATATVAGWIAERLMYEGWETTREEAAKASSVTGYDLVVMGSGVYSHALLPEMDSFIKQNADQLKKLPVAFFAVAMRAEAMFVNGKVMGGVQVFEKYADVGKACIYADVLHGESVYAAMNGEDKKSLDDFYLMAGFSESEIIERKKPRTFLNKTEAWTFAENLLKRMKG